MKPIVIGIVTMLVIVCGLFCGRREERIDIMTRTMLQSQDTIPLEITHMSPVGKTEGFHETAKILVGFNQPMIPLQQIAQGAKEGPMEIQPPLRGRYQWLGTRTLAFVLDDTIQPATQFSVTLVHKKIKSLTGMTLDRDTSWTFESARPQLLSSFPYDGAQFIELNSAIYLLFNTEMSTKRIGNKIKIYYTKGMPSDVWCGQVKSETPRFRGEAAYSVRYLRDEEKKGYPLSEWDNAKTLVLVPKGNLPVESQIEVTLYPGLRAKNGNLGLEEEKIISLNTYNKFSLLDYSETVPAEEPLVLCFANQVNVSAVFANLEIEPKVEVPPEYQEEDWSTNEVYLYLPFVPGKKYEVRINKGLKDIYNNRLDKDYRFTFEKGDYTPHVEMPTGISILETEGALRFPVNVVNVDSVQMQLGRIGIDQAVSLLNTPELFYSQNAYKPREPGFFRVSRLWRVNAFRRFRNQQLRMPIELNEVLGTLRTGLLFVQLDHLGQSRYSADYPFQKAFVEVSDIGITWKYSPENNLIWATSLHDTRPLKNATVQIRSDNNRVLWEGLTNAQGFCESPGWAELGLGKEGEEGTNAGEYVAYDEPGLWLTILNGSDAAVYSNRWSFGIDPWRFDIDYNWYVEPEEYGVHIFTEKGLYRSGETVHIKGIIRKKSRGQWVLPDFNKLSLVVRDSREEDVVIDTLSINLFGAFHDEISLSQDAPTGVYSINANPVGKLRTFYETFRVEAYRPAEFEVGVTAPKDTFVADEAFIGSIEGRYLFGMPMSDAKVSWNLRRSDYYLNFPEHEGYQFGEYVEGRERELLGSGTGTLDAKGEYKVTKKLSKDDIYAPSQIFLEGNVTAPNMTILAGVQNWVALSASYLIGLKTAHYLYVLGDTVQLSVIALTPGGSMISDRNVKLETFKTEWKSIKKARLGGRYEWISEKVETKVAEQRIKSRSDSTLAAVVPESPGYYYVRASGVDSKRRQTITRIYFYVAGHGDAGWEMRDDDIIELVADKDNYQINDTAHVLVKSPYDSARCLVTIERELVIDKFVKLLQGNADYIEIPIKPGYLPNVYVCVTLLRGRVEGLTWDEKTEQDLGKPQFKIGYLNLNVNAEQKHLQVIVNPDKTDYEPRENVNVKLEVKDHNNRPVANGEVALFVVDVGVLNLIDFKTPDPFAQFYGNRPLSVRTIESRVNILGERSYGEKGEDRGGGGAFAEGVAYREKFIATAFYKADIHTDKTGKASVRFQLPDNLTKFRIMAVALTKESQFGSADSTLVVNQPFMITPSIPRFARVGDAFRAGVVLHNRTPHKENAFVECSAQGLKQIDAKRKEITLPPNSSKEVLFQFNAQDTGKAVFEFAARMGAEADAVRLVIPIALPPLFEAVATFSSTSDSVTEAIIVPSQILEGMGGLQITLSPTVIAGLDRGIDFLLDYPYYCLEQLMSKVLPLIVGEKLINEFKLATVTGRTLRDTVQAVLNSVPAYQKPDGGFVYFKETNYPCPYLSAYTMYVLHRAQTAGYKVDKETVARGISFLHGVLRWQEGDWTYPYDEDAQLTTRAFCLYALALWDDVEHAYVTNIYERRNQLSIFGRTLLLKTVRQLHMGSSFENELTRNLINKIKISPTSAHFEEDTDQGWTFPSPAKVTASVLQTLIELRIPFPYTEQVVRWLVQERSKKTKPTTQENAFVFDALQAYYNTYEREVPDFAARVLLGQEEVLQQTFKGRTNEPPIEHNIGFDRLPKDTLIPLKVSKQGSGRVYYTLRMNYALKEKRYPFDGGFYVWKEFLTLNGKRVKKFARGEVYKVVVHVVTPETRLFVVVDDPLPAGFVPVQTFFATESREISERYEEATWEGMKHWWGGFDHEEYYDDRVLYFAQQLYPGEHTETYFVRAASPGRFLSPETMVEEMYAPEVFGSSEQEYIVVE